MPGCRIAISDYYIMTEICPSIDASSENDGPRSVRSGRIVKVENGQLELRVFTVAIVN